MKRIFFIYTEATVACLMLLGSFLELLCGLAVPEIGMLTYPASALFLAAAVQQMRVIIKSETA